MKKIFLSRKCVNPLFVIVSLFFLQSCASTSQDVSSASQEVREPISNSVPQKVEEKEATSGRNYWKKVEYKEGPSGRRLRIRKVLVNEGVEGKK